MIRHRIMHTTLLFLVVGTLVTLFFYGIHSTNIALALWGPRAPTRESTRSPETTTATTVWLATSTSSLTAGEPFTLTVGIRNLSDRVSAFQFDLTYDTNIIRFVGMEPGADLRATQRSIVCPQAAYLNTGIRLACATTGEAPGLGNTGEMAVLTFIATNNGQSDITPQAIQLYNDVRPPQAMSVTGEGIHVSVGTWYTWLPFIAR